MEALAINALTNPLFYVIVVFTLGGMLGFLGLIMSIYAIIEVKALQRSTHSVQYMPIDPEIDKENSEYTNKWATSEASLREQDKLYNEDLEAQMPSFLPDEEDKKTYSF